MLDWLKHKVKPRMKLDRRQMLAARPVRSRHIKWEESDEGVVLHVPTAAPGGKSRLFPAPKARTVVLDRIGSELWRRIDGQATTESLIEWMHDRWQFSWKEAEMGVTNYLGELMKRNLVLLAG